MKVSFTGIKNIGYKDCKLHPVARTEDGRVMYSQDDYVVLSSMNMQLTDDFNGKDLSRCKQLVQNSSAENKEHPIYPDSLNFSIVKGEMENDKDIYFMVNFSNLEVKDENLPIISYITNVLKNIVKSPNDYPIEPARILHRNTSKAILPGLDIREEIESEIDYLTEMMEIHKPSNIQKGAKGMLELIDKKMSEYFDV